MCRTRILIFVIGILLSIMCGCQDQNPRYHYIEREKVIYEEVIIPVYLDVLFSDKEEIEIELGLDRWNKTLNGYMRFEYAGKMDMEIGILKKIVNGEAYGIFRLSEGDDILKRADESREEGEKVLGFVNKVGGSYMYLVPTRMDEGDIYYIVMHETGHLLGARHTSEGIMRGSYIRGYNGLCIDKSAIEQIIIGRNWELEKINYCVKD
jgi:hypothetical protein